MERQKIDDRPIRTFAKWAFPVPSFEIAAAVAAGLAATGWDADIVPIGRGDDVAHYIYAQHADTNHGTVWHMRQREA